MAGSRDERAARHARTIAAIASPPGPGARGLIRVSGPRAAELVRATTTPHHTTLLDRATTFDPSRPGSSALDLSVLDLSVRRLVEGRFDDGRGTQPVLLLWMPGPRSFTREDVAEFHLPGSPPLLARALDRLLELGATAAEPGEFTRRAFLSGRIDLTRAEGVLALVTAHNEAQARAAKSLLFGGLETRVAAARDALVDARTLCEASLDFDENDTGHVPREEITALLSIARARIESALGFESARIGPSGAPRIVLAGAPNAGKSALFNALSGFHALSGEGAALVSPRAGTTRDVLDAPVTLLGVGARLYDTAGLAPADRDSEREAQARARAALESADLVLWVVDASTARREALAAAAGELGASPRHLVWNKIDLAPAPPPSWLAELGAELRSAQDSVEGALDVSAVSARTGVGLDRLRARIAAALAQGSEAGGLERDTALRHRTALDAARTEADRAALLLDHGTALELVAEHARRATEALDAVCGATTAEDVLDRIFARFCLGK